MKFESERNHNFLVYNNAELATVLILYIIQQLLFYGLLTRQMCEFKENHSLIIEYNHIPCEVYE